MGTAHPANCLIIWTMFDSGSLATAGVAARTELLAGRNATDCVGWAVPTSWGGPLAAIETMECDGAP